MYTESYSKNKFRDEIASVFHDLMLRYGLNLKENSMDGFSLSNDWFAIDFNYLLGQVTCDIDCALLGIRDASCAMAYGLVFPGLKLPESVGDIWDPMNALIWEKKLVSQIISQASSSIYS
ncbi:MAG: hypothetical protein JNM00_05550 [Flavobacteriales bacterium]|nr:hypothetical protein [Flavobacteriales bacterium]